MSEQSKVQGDDAARQEGAAGAVAGAGGTAAALTSPMQYRDFRVYFAGQFISLVGMWMQQFAMGWVISDLTKELSVFATISLVASIPLMVFSFPGGVLADRYDRRKILMVTQAVLGALALVYAWLVWSGRLTIPLVYVMGCIVSAVAAFDFPSQQALVPQLVPPPLIPKAVGMNQAIFHGSRFIGPALAGILIAVTSESAAFVANGLSYLAVIYSLSIIPSRPHAAGAPKKNRGAMKEAVQYVSGQPIVRTLIASTGLQTAFVMPIFVVFIMLAGRSMFHASETQMGIIMGASGLGALHGSVWMMKVPARLRGKGIIYAAAMAATMTVVLSFAHSAYVAAAIIFVLNTHTALALGLASTIIQVVVPDALRGRVMGLYAITFTGIMPLAAFAEGFIGDAVGAPTLIRALGATYGVSALLLLFSAGMWSLAPPSAVIPQARTASTDIKEEAA